MVSNILYIHQISMDGSRIKTVYSTNSMESIIAVDYNYRYINVIVIHDSMAWNITFHIGKVICIGVLLMKTVARFGSLDWMDLRPYHFISVMYTL